MILMTISNQVQQKQKERKTKGGKMRKIIFKNPDLSKNETTELTASITAGTTTLSVVNSFEFADNDFILIEKVGNEKAEIKQISSVTDETTIVLSSATDFDHDQDIQITKLDFNQMKLNKSTDGSSFSLIQTQDIDYQDENNVTIFIDGVGTNTDYYRVDYYNSHTTNEYQNDVIKPLTLLGYISYDDFLEETGLKSLTRNIVEHAIRHGAQEIGRRLYAPRKQRSDVQDTEQQLPSEVGELQIADRFLDGAVTKDDITAYEEDTDGVRTDISSDITTLDRDRFLITFGTARPTNGKILYMEYAVAPRKLEDMDEALREINKLYAVNFLFTNIPFRKLQRGISSYVLNGVSISFDRDTMNQIIEQNQKRIRTTLDRLHRVYLKPLTLRRPKFDLFEFRSTLRFR